MTGSIRSWEPARRVWLQTLVDAHLSADAPAVTSFQSSGPWPRVSIIIPSLNQGRFLAAALRSIVNQGYPNTEIVVVDAGSMDETEAVVESFGSAVTTWISEPDQGQSDALNKGFALATGEIFGSLGADDAYLPGAFFVAAEAIRTTGASVVYGDQVEIDVDGQVLEEHLAMGFNRVQFMVEGFTLWTQSLFWTRRAHERAGPFDVELHRTMDSDFIFRLSADGGGRTFTRVAVPMGCFRRHPDQKTQGFDDGARAEGRRIAERNGVPWIHGPVGRALRLPYRGRRAWWYWRRGGLGYALHRFGRNRRSTGGGEG